VPAEPESRDNQPNGGLQVCENPGADVVPGFPGTHSQRETLDDLQDNIQEVIAMLLEDGEPVLG
jgi:hypothetical protein